MIEIEEDEQVLELDYFVEDEIDEIEQLFLVQSYSGKEYDMIEYIVEYISSMNVDYEIDVEGNILITKGSIEKNEYYPCVVAHMDTVHKPVDNIKINLTLHEDDHIIYATEKKKDGTEVEAGLGGDKFIVSL